jgi:hypothetical protein
VTLGASDVDTAALTCICYYLAAATVALRVPSGQSKAPYMDTESDAEGRRTNNHSISDLHCALHELRTARDLSAILNSPE